MGKVRVAVIGPNEGKNGFGLGAHIIKEVAQHPNAVLVAIGGSTYESLKRNLPTESIDVQRYSIVEMEALFMQPDIDLVIISSPASSHLAYIQLGIKHNKHLLVEKPIFEIMGKVDDRLLVEVNSLFTSARNKRLYLSTNCQRAFIPCFFGLNEVKESVVVEMGIGRKKMLINHEMLLMLTISHPVSILVKLGLTNVNEYSLKGIDIYSVNSENHIKINFIYNNIKGKIILKQYSSECSADINLKVDEVPEIHAISEKRNGEYFTKYETNRQVFYDKDLLSNAIHKMIGAITEQENEPLISNNESYLIFQIEQLIYKTYFKHAIL